MPYRRMLATLVAALLAFLAVAAPATAQDRDNRATAVNQQDGATEVDISFDVQHVLDGVVNQTNAAQAFASCQECQTIAIAIQVILVSGPVDNVAVPVNSAEAVNVECTACLTVAFAYQFIFANGERLRFTHEARRRLAALARAFRKLEKAADKGRISGEDVLAELDDLMNELSDVLATGIEPSGPDRGGHDGAPPVDEQQATDQDGAHDTTPPGTSPSATPAGEDPGPAPPSAADEEATPAPTESGTASPTATPTPTGTATPTATAGTATPSATAETSPSATP